MCMFGIANSLRYNGFRFALPSPWGLGYKNTPEFIMPKRVIRQRWREMTQSNQKNKYPKLYFQKLFKNVFKIYCKNVSLIVELK